MFHVLEGDRKVYMILELIEHGDMFELIQKRGFLPEPETKFVFYQLMLAVQYLHDQGISHRDIKPENIMIKQVNEDGAIHVALTDFGLAKMFGGNQSMLKTMCGTLNVGFWFLKLFNIRSI